MYGEEVASRATRGQDGVAGSVAAFLVGSGWGSNDGCACASEFGGDESDAMKVGRALFFCVTKI